MTLFITLLTTVTTLAEIKPLPDSLRHLVEVKCIARMPTTSFVLKLAEQDRFTVTMIHHNGFQFSPVHFGIVVPHDQKLIQEKSTILSSIPDRSEFTFQTSKCRSSDDGRLECRSGQHAQFGSYKMSPLSFSISKITEQNLTSSYETSRVTLQLHVENYVPVIDLVMDYQPDECQWKWLEL